MIIPYPPGIPVLYPGETVTPEMADYLIRLDQAGAKFQGASLGDNHTIAVFAT